MSLLHALLRIDGTIHPFVVLFALVFPFLFIERLALRRKIVRALLPLAAMLVIFFLLFYMAPSLALNNAQHFVACDIRQLAFLCIPIVFLFFCEPSGARDRLLKVSVVLLAALSLNQFLLVKTGTMTGNGAIGAQSEAAVRKVLDTNYGHISQLRDKEKYYPPGPVNSSSPLWQDVRNVGGDWPDQLLVTHVIVETSSPTWHSFFTDLYWHSSRSVPLCWAGGLPTRSWFCLEGDTLEQGKRRWEKMLDDKFALQGRPVELQSQHLTTEPADVVPVFIPPPPSAIGMPPGAPAPPPPPPGAVR